MFPYDPNQNLEFLTFLHIFSLHKIPDSSTPSIRTWDTTFKMRLHSLTSSAPWQHTSLHNLGSQILSTVYKTSVPIPALSSYYNHNKSGIPIIFFLPDCIFDGLGCEKSNHLMMYEVCLTLNTVILICLQIIHPITLWFNELTS